jgi:hypothetical protein
MENCLQSPTSSPTSLPASSRNNVHGKNNLPVIIGAIMGGLLVVVSIALVLLYLACYSRKVFSQGKLEMATIATPSREGLVFLSMFPILVDSKILSFLVTICEEFELLYEINDFPPCFSFDFLNSYTDSQVI